MVVGINVLNPTFYAEYASQVPKIIKKYGGRYLVPTEEIIPLAESWIPEKTVLLECDTIDQLRAGLLSVECGKIILARDGQPKAGR